MKDGEVGSLRWLLAALNYWTMRWLNKPPPLQRLQVLLACCWTARGQSWSSEVRVAAPWLALWTRKPERNLKASQNETLKPQLPVVDESKSAINSPGQASLHLPVLADVALKAPRPTLTHPSRRQPARRRQWPAGRGPAGRRRNETSWAGFLLVACLPAVGGLGPLEREDWWRRGLDQEI